MSHDAFSLLERCRSAQVEKRHRQLYVARTAHYDELKKLKAENRQNYEENARSIFAEHQIPYEKKGHSWLCTIRNEQLYY